MCNTLLGGVKNQSRQHQENFLSNVNLVYIMSYRNISIFKAVATLNYRTKEIST